MDPDRRDPPLPAREPGSSRTTVHVESHVESADPLTRSRRSGSTGFYVLLVVALAAMAYLCWPFLVPLFLAAVLAAAMMPLELRLGRALGGRGRIAAALLSLAVLLVIVSPLATVGGVLTRQALAGLESLRNT